MKEYNGEKAIISLTSWKARINTVHKTIANLIGMCPGFHIVLCLSEEEFPKKEAELPENLMRFVNLDLLEILWVYKNYKSFKKVLFTMDKYKEVPVISADDDCIYTCNYAEKLYEKWIDNKRCFISYTVTPSSHETWGYATLHFPNCYKSLWKKYLDVIYKNNFFQDDKFYVLLRKQLKINDNIIQINFEKNYSLLQKNNSISFTHTIDKPITSFGKNNQNLLIKEQVFYRSII